VAEIGAGEVTIRNARGDDITHDLTSAAETHGIPLELALGVAIAESGLRPDAERWGTLTTQARDAITNRDMVLLQDIIMRAWPDISYGYGQQIVKFHYLGDLSPTVDNCLAVRTAVFNDPVTNLRDMCKRLAARLKQAQQTSLSRTDGDVLLMAAVIYNRGHIPVDVAEWTAIQSRVDHYRRSLAQARAMLAAIPTNDIPNSIPNGGTMTAIDDRAAQIGEDKTGPKHSEIDVSEITKIGLYNNCVMLETPNGVYALSELSVMKEFLPNP
jgi:hypothetical protein